MKASEVKMPRVTMTETREVAENGIKIRRFEKGETVETTLDAQKCIVRNGWGYDPDDKGKLTGRASAARMREEAEEAEEEKVKKPGPDLAVSDAPAEPAWRTGPGKRKG